MRAEIISIGTELLLGQITDTNAATLGEFLARQGITHTHRQTVGDNLPRIVEAIQLALTRAEIIFTIGGLGPTPDDLTRLAIAQSIGEELTLDEAIKAHLIEEYGKRGLKMSESQFRQAEGPPSGTPIPNPNGTAPGLHTEKDNHHIFALPGPKSEFGPMLAGPVKEILDQIHSGDPLHSRTLRVVGVSEAIIGEKLASLMDAKNPTVAPYAKTGEVHLRITTSAATTEEADKIINPIADQIHTILGSAIYAEGEESLAAWIIQELTRRGQTIATAESCTGGLLAAEFTSIDGSSKVFPAGFVTYSAESKHRELGVDLETLRTDGTVAEPTAIEMATGARERAQTDFAISITGVAGAAPLDEPPSPKASGLVFVGIASPQGNAVHRLHFRGSRDIIRTRAVIAALIRFRDILIVI
jgi:nicotinamide-nucleotide amidase